jgi:hypothetical protein
MNLYSLINEDTKSLKDKELNDYLLHASPYLMDYENKPDNRKHTLQEFKRELGNWMITETDTSDSMCSLCSSENMMYNEKEALLICQDCGNTSEYQDGGLTFKESVDTQVLGKYSYKRMNHFNEWLVQFQGCEKTEIPDSVIQLIKEELRKTKVTNITNKKMRSILKKLNLGKYYENISIINHMVTGKQPPNLDSELIDRLRLMFQEIQNPFNNHCPSERKNFLSYSFVLYKFCELLGKDEYLVHFPLLKSRDKLRVCDSIWKKICNDLEWEYIPTI